MDWTSGLANDGVRRTAVLAAFGAGSLYVLYNILDGYMKKPPTTTSVKTNGTSAKEAESFQVVRARSATPSQTAQIIHIGPEELIPIAPNPLSVEESLEVTRQFANENDEEPQSAPEQIEEQTDQLTELIESLKYNGARNLNEDEVDCLGFLLTTNIESLLCETLGILSNCSAFSKNQDSFRDQGVINQVKKLTRHESDIIKVQALTATANLCVNDENQAEFIDEIPYYLELAFREGCTMLSIVALYVLTNLTVKFGSYPEVLDHATLLASKAVCAGKDESLQAMKVLVNISCEEEGSEFLVKANLREDFFDLIRSEPAISQRCLTILANIIPKIQENSTLEDLVLGLKSDMLRMWRSDSLEEGQRDQLKRALKALSIKGWGRLSESTMDLVNKG